MASAASTPEGLGGKLPTPIGKIRYETYGGKRAYTTEELQAMLETMQQVRKDAANQYDMYAYELAAEFPGAQSYFDRKLRDLDAVIDILSAGLQPGRCREEMSDLLECIHAKG